MERRKTIRVREIMLHFWRDNPELYHKMMEARVMRLWGELIDPSIVHYTNSLHVKNGVLYVSMSSSVARSELISVRKRLIDKLNKHAGAHVIDDIMIR